LFLLFLGTIVLQAYALTSPVPYVWALHVVTAVFALLTGLSFVEGNDLKRFKTIGKRFTVFSKLYQDVFSWLLVTYLVLLVVRSFTALPFNADWMLVPVLLAGVLTVVFPAKVAKVAKRTHQDTWLIWGLGVVGTVLIFLKTGSLGWLQYVISLLGGALIVLLSYLVYEKEELETPVYLFVTPNGVALSVAVLFVLSAVLSFWLGLSAFRVVFGAVFVLFVPGFSLSYAFFGSKEIDVLERIALSFALSIAVVPLIVFYLNLAGMRISALSVSIVVVFVTALGYVVYRYKPFLVQRFSKKKNNVRKR
jgi:hypothetical protein